jgi:hypothetical protein
MNPVTRSELDPCSRSVGTTLTKVGRAKLLAGIGGQVWKVDFLAALVPGAQVPSLRIQGGCAPNSRRAVEQSNPPFLL